MKRQNNQRWQLPLLISIGAIFLFSLFGATFAQTEKARPKDSLPADIIGAWEDKHGNDTIRLTFDKDGAFVLKQEESAPDKGTYTVRDDQTVEIRVTNRPVLKRKVKITGDTMQLTSNKGQTETLKRVK